MEFSFGGRVVRLDKDSLIRQSEFFDINPISNRDVVFVCGPILSVMYINGTSIKFTSMEWQESCYLRTKTVQNT